jgi:hypothetical protein
MTLTAGTRLGPYEIQSPLAAGGMGEVYRARDARLGREVALKVLPESFSRDPDRLRRFEQEARAVAALNHPNILSIHDIGNQGGTRFIVSELLEGNSLRAELEHGALSPRKAADYAAQIAQGLAAAHNKSIIHRDLKPENVFVTKEGRVKILDFGLAKLAPSSTAKVEPGGLTLTSSPTEAGIVMGTAGYMAPEQVRGSAVDSRTDIFAFGAVLYEMVSGRRAFHHDTAAETMTAILREDPPEFNQMTQPVSPGLERIVRRCLEKVPEQRFQSAKDLAFALEALSGTSQVTARQAVLTTARPKPWAAVVATVAVIAAAILAYFAGARNRNEPARFELLTFQRGYIKGVRFAPDGQNVVYSATWDGRPYEVFTTRIGDHNARSLELTNALVVGISAAGEVAVLTNVKRIRTTSWVHVGTLARTPANGGPAREILEAVWDADISRDGKQFAVVRKPAGPQQLEYPIGKVLAKTTGYISHPRISPDGKRVAFLEHPLFGDDRGYLAVAEVNGDTKRLTAEAAAVDGLAWSPDGDEIWYAATGSETRSPERTVHAVTLDGKARKVFGVPGDVTVWDIAADGRLLFTHETIGSAQLVASPATAPERNVTVLGHGVDGIVSSDGKTIAFTESGPGAPDDYLVFFRRLDSPAAVELGEGNIIGMTPDGKYVVALVPSQPTKLRILPTGAGEARTFDIGPVQVGPGTVSWMPGAKEFVFLGHEGVAPPRAYRVSLGGGPASLLTKSEGAQFWNKVSPDGKSVLQGTSIGTDSGQDVIVDLSTGQARPVPLQEGEAAIDWDEDGQHIFVVDEGEGSATIFRVDAFTGRREVWKQIRPTDPAGTLSLSHFYVTPSGNAYAYSAERVLSALYVYSQK